MMKNKKPEIRFKGFSEEWTERELDTVFHKIRNAFVGVATPYYVSEGHFYLESNNVKDGQINRNNEIFINDEFYEKQKNNWLHTGDIAMVQSGHVGHSAVIPPELNNTAAHALIIFAEPKEKINSHFLNYQFQTTQTKKGLRDITTGNTIKHILSSEMKRFNVFMSGYDEQTQIGNFFKNLDNLITLHQRKYEKLGVLKKAMLEKMFPKNGKDVPEIRFKGFEGAWEERILGDISADTYGGGTPKTSITDFWSGNIPWIQSSDIIDKQLSNVKFKKSVSERAIKESATKLIPANSIAIVTRVGVGKLAFIDYDYATSQDFLSLSKLKIDSWFGVYSIWKKIQSELHAVQGTSIKGITKEELLSKSILVPLHEEQEKIGNYFKNLDNLLTLHQGELGKLKNLKKAMLEKMFV
jgi:type I restriction enzyme, S subunit